jgi:hypothetical protein
MELCLRPPFHVRFLGPALLLAACVRQQPAASPLHGLVRDTEGVAVSGARVGIVGTLYEALTDSLGQYAFDSVPVGSYNVRVGQFGYHAVQRDSIAIGWPARVRLDFNLRPGAPICELGPCK